jgi:NADP-dependent 3-hydroxy acid dehydrogenase YdfG
MTSSRSDPARVALVTGARRGIGRAVATKFLAEGWYVALNDIEATELVHTVAELAVPTGRVTAHSGDVGTAHAAGSLVQEVVASHGRLDALVNNAATIRFSPFLDFTEIDLTASLSTNAAGAFFCTQAAARHWIEVGVSGVVVMVSSVSAHQARPGHAAYGASKAAMEMIAEVAALELGARDPRELRRTRRSDPHRVRRPARRSSRLRGAGSSQCPHGSDRSPRGSSRCRLLSGIRAVLLRHWCHGRCRWRCLHRTSLTPHVCGGTV